MRLREDGGGWRGDHFHACAPFTCFLSFFVFFLFFLSLCLFVFVSFCFCRNDFDYCRTSGLRLAMCYTRLFPAATIRETNVGPCPGKRMHEMTWRWHGSRWVRSVEVQGVDNECTARRYLMLPS